MLESEAPDAIYLPQCERARSFTFALWQFRDTAGSERDGTKKETMPRLEPTAMEELYGLALIAEHLRCLVFMLLTTSPVETSR